MKYTMSELLEVLLKLQCATLGTDEDGELVIYTSLREKGDGTLEMIQGIGEMPMIIRGDQVFFDLDGKSREIAIDC